MQRIEIGNWRRSPFRALTVLTFVLALAVGCGPIGDKKDDGKATETVVSVAQPTEPETTAETGTTTETAVKTESVVTEVPTAPTDSLSTPAVTKQVNPTGPFSTPAGTAVVATEFATTAVLAPGEGTPTPGTGPATEVSTITAASTEAAVVPVSGGSDGTSGATPEPNATFDVAPDETPAPSASPGAFFVREETTPDLSKAPEDGNLASAKPLSVDSCKPAQVTPMPGQPLGYVTLYELNFRSGPGSDCTLIGETPIAEGVEVQVISWPVTRAGDEDNVWIQVRIDNKTGWVVIDGLEPANP